MRATDRERQRAVGKLRGAYLRGALSTDTFETRAGAAYRSQTTDDLAGVVFDLPTMRERARRLVSEISMWFSRVPSLATALDERVIELPPTPGKRIFVGRDRRCDVVVDDPEMSRWHLEISYDGREWEARDLASTNGTFIWDRRISVGQARPGDVLYAGRYALRLTQPPAINEIGRGVGSRPDARPVKAGTPR